MTMTTMMKLTHARSYLLFKAAALVSNNDTWTWKPIISASPLRLLSLIPSYRIQYDAAMLLHDGCAIKQTTLSSVIISISPSRAVAAPAVTMLPIILLLFLVYEIMIMTVQKE